MLIQLFGGKSAEPVIEPLNLSPETTAHTIYPTTCHGFGPVTVNAVTSAIDENIVSSNIKDGVTILGVTGTYEGGSATIVPLSVSPDVVAQTYSPSGGTDGYGPVTVGAVDSSIDANITAGNIKNGVSILGVAGSVVELDGTTVSLSPSTSQQTVTPTAPHNGFTSVTVDAVTSAIDANIVAGNIKDGITILGVTGNYTGGGSSYNIEKIKNANNKLICGNSVIDLTGVTDLGDNVLCGAYSYNTGISGALDLSSLTQITGTRALRQAFLDTNITSVDMSSVVSISGLMSLTQAFSNTPITSVDVSALTTVSARHVFEQAFANCTLLTSVTFAQLSLLTGDFAFISAFYGCTRLTSLSFPALTSSSFGTYMTQFYNMLNGVTGCTVHFPSNLQAVMGSWTDVTNGFGGTNTTVLFDLPATT